MQLKISTLLVTALMCFTPVSALAGTSENPDPWEPFNRRVDAFNQYLDKHFLVHVARAYDAVTPTLVDDGITNVFENLRSPVEVLNSLLQGKPKQAGVDAGRFVINSTVGLFGVFDVASYAGLLNEYEDFGQTLAVWGVPQGPYLILPFLGPSTVRDAFGRTVDSSMNGTAAVDHSETRMALEALLLIDDRADLLDAEGLISGDAYVFTRGAYLDRRNYLINDGEVSLEDGFGDENFDSWD